ncbi:MAG: hypothetical protein NVS3B20_26250 [Polyangiales bacterium]
MLVPVNLRFIAEVSTFQLRYTCDDCAHFIARDAGQCGHGYPLGERRAKPLALGGEVAFCKEFEG